MRVLFVSKAVVPPFHDGSQILVREIASALPSFQPCVCTAEGQTEWARTRGIETLAIYKGKGGFAPALWDNARMLGALLTDTRADVWHFVFAPNPRSCRVARTLKRVRRVPILQTIASPPKSFDNVDGLLFGDVVVAQSEWTKRRLQAGLRRAREVVLIRPPVGEIARPDAAALEQLRERLALGPEARVVVYPGDLEFSRGAERVAAMVEASPADKSQVVVFACRKKTARAHAIEDALRRRLDPARVRFAGELPSLLPLLALAHVVVFPVEELFAKVDIPIALLEAMQLGVPLVVSDTGPVAELRGPLQVAPEDIQGISDALLKLQETPGLHEAVVRAQKEQIENEFRSKVVAARYEALYHGLCSR